jgi:hypothetical protein
VSASVLDRYLPRLSNQGYLDKRQTVKGKKSVWEYKLSVKGLSFAAQRTGIKSLDNEVVEQIAQNPDETPINAIKSLVKDMSQSELAKAQALIEEQALQRLDEQPATPIIPAFCATCDTIFPSGFALSNSKNSKMRGNTTGPCPNCGSMGRILDGTYDVLGQELTYRGDDNRLMEIFKRAVTENIRARVIFGIKRVNIPILNQNFN